MPYKLLSDLPKNVRSAFPKHAQKIYQDAYNNAWDEYKKLKIGKREETTHSVSRSAVKQKYKKARINTG